MSYIVVDLDTTLADNTHREHLAQAKQWDAFHAAMGGDGVYDDVYQLITGLEEANFGIVFLTAREEKYRSKTIAWLDSRVYGVGDELIMRDRPHNEESAGDFKLRKLQELEKLRGSKPVFCLEDQMNITLKLRAAGFSVFNVRNSHA